jgi:hypothetical protein
VDSADTLLFETGAAMGMTGTFGLHAKHIPEKMMSGVFFMGDLLVQLLTPQGLEQLHSLCLSISVLQRRNKTSFGLSRRVRFESSLRPLFVLTVVTLTVVTSFKATECTVVQSVE